MVFWVLTFKSYFSKENKFFPTDITLKGKNYLDIKDFISINEVFKRNNIKSVINCSCEPATSKSKKIVEYKCFRKSKFD